MPKDPEGLSGYKGVKFVTDLFLTYSLPYVLSISLDLFPLIGLLGYRGTLGHPCPR